MAQITLGIDFGSSFCTIVKKEEGIVLKEPNMIAVKKDGRYKMKDKNVENRIKLERPIAESQFFLRLTMV